jgi:hypothetical protein
VLALVGVGLRFFGVWLERDTNAAPVTGTMEAPPSVR